jgi:chitinase domain-containing protein 1
MTRKSFGLAMSIQGENDVDTNWMNSVRTPKSSDQLIPKMVPRIHFPELTAEFISDEKAQRQLIADITEICTKYGFDGIVLDTGFLGLLLKSQDLTLGLSSFYSKLSQDLRSHQFLFILVLPANRHQRSFYSPHEISSINPVVDYFSVMTYDYSSSIADSNSPISWIDETWEEIVGDRVGMERDTISRKLLFGIPFYGYDWAQVNRQWSPNVILGSDLLTLLKRVKPKSSQFEWKESSAEHVLSYTENGQQHTVFYPTLNFIKKRTELLASYKAGISIWEIGQGLDYFYDLL